MILTLESTSATHPNKNKMKKTYMTPSITMMDLDKETPIICASMGSNTPPTHDSTPTTDSNLNLFSTGSNGWNASNWQIADEEEDF